MVVDAAHIGDYTGEYSRGYSLDYSDFRVYGFRIGFGVEGFWAKDHFLYPYKLAPTR